MNDKPTKEEALIAVKNIIEDVDLFLDGMWEPDEDSMEALQNNAILIQTYLKGNK